MKKVLGIFTVVIVLSLAGSTLAYGAPSGEPDKGPGQRGEGKSWRQDGPGHGPGWKHAPMAKRWHRDMPEEIRDKMVAAEKLKIDMRAEMSKPETDKAKAQTTSELWVPGVNALGGFGRWKFEEFRDWTVMENDFAGLVDRLMDGKS